MIYEYIRVADNHKDGTVDSLEKMCTELGKQGWRVISISDGSQYRYATMERQIDGTDNKQTDIGSEKNDNTPRPTRKSKLQS
jgi:hypothetical protein